MDEVANQINKGQSYHLAGDLDKAERCYRAALAIEPRHPIGRYNLGVVLEDTGREPEAIEEYRAALSLDRYQPHARHNLARLLQAEARRQQYAIFGMRLKGIV